MSVKCQHHNLKCHFCNGNHACRDCPVEAENAPTYRKKVGTQFEEWVSCNIECPNCKGHLRVKGDHTPSLDLVCDNPDCKQNKFECKSKCLSVNSLPKDILLPHGSYNDFLYQINNGLNLIVIIYGIDRINKTINVREVIHADNKDLMNFNVIEVKKRENSNLSSIFIKDRNKLKKINHSTKNLCIKF
jgi:hypothetical protein